MTEDEKHVFYVKFKCRNCGNKFKKRGRKGDEIESTLFNSNYHFKSKDSIGGVIECPICGSEKLSIEERKPINDLSIL